MFEQILLTRKAKPQIKKSFPCDKCGKDHTHLYLLKRHLVSHNGGKEREFKCESCEKAYTTKIALINHVKSIHEKMKEFNCEFCGKQFGANN